MHGQTWAVNGKIGEDQFTRAKKADYCEFVFVRHWGVTKC